MRVAANDIHRNKNAVAVFRGLGEVQRNCLDYFTGNSIAPRVIQMHDGTLLVGAWQATNPIREQID